MKNNKNESGQESPWLDADEIKRRVSITEVLEKYGHLDGMKQSGKRLKGLSPFREESKPSFFADTEKNIWNDFGGRPEGVPGNVIGLVQAFEGCGFREALVILHRDFIGETLSPAREARPAPAPAPAPAKEEAEELHNEPWGKQLKGRTNIPFLKDKGITEETVRAFGVVYCTSGMHKGRIAIPVRNKAGEILCYAGRALKKADEEENGKYRFPPGFNKSIEVYNLDRLYGDAKARKAVRDFGIILVEGFFDLMKLCQEGFANVAAIMGTDLHERQKKELLNPELNPSRRITLFLDNDKAGQEGKRRMARGSSSMTASSATWTGAAPPRTKPNRSISARRSS